MRKEQNGSINLIVVGVVVIALIAGAFFFVTSSSNDDMDESANTTTSPSQPESDQPEQSEDNEGNYEEINLEAVGGQSGEGGAIRSVGDPTFTHELYAKTTDPADGKFYEGWLVTGDSIVSTGKLEKDAEGTWRLTYTTSDDLSNHNTVVVTEETEANGLDGKPEKHILEGKF